MIINGDYIAPSVGNNISVPEALGINIGNNEVGRITSTFGGFKGNVIQTSFGQLTTRFTTSSASFVDTGLTASITPKYNNSKILIFFNCGASNGSATTGLSFNLVRGSTNIAQSTGATYNQSGISYFANASALSSISLCFLDEPNSNSQLVYKIQINSTSAGVTVAINGRPTQNDYSGYSGLILMELQV